MAYEPQEGVDYLVDLYAVAGVRPEIDGDELSGVLRQQIRQYHPDRLEGMAPELRARGERMTQLLNRARVILLDTDKRGEYDEILGSWEGPVSTDGAPVITMERYVQATMGQMEPDEVEAAVAQQVGKVEALTGYSPTLLEFLEDMVTQANGEVPDALRAQYEEALLAYDRVLAIEDSQRSEILGRPSISERRYVVDADYANTVKGEIETTRQERIKELERFALANVSGRLALMAGEAASVQVAPGTELAVAGKVELPELPSYFEPQAERVQELAAKRQEVARKRLANFKPSYPEAEAQTDALPNLVIGILVGGATTWLSVDLEPETNVANIVDVSESVLELLQRGELISVIQQGYNILTLSVPEQLSVEDLLSEAIRKHLLKYGDGD